MARTNNKNQRGAALGMVLVFMTFMITLGTALIVAAQYGATQSAALIKADRYYYAAESGAQLAAQVFMANMSEDDYFLEEENIDGAVDIDEYIKGMKRRLLTHISTFFTDMFTQIDGMTFNGEIVNVVPAFPVTEDDIASDWEEAVDINGDTTYTAVVYFDNPKFVISVISGGRTVTFETNADVSATVTSRNEDVEGGGGGGGGGDAPDSGAYFGDNSGGIFGSGNQDKYNEYIGSLTDMLEIANEQYENHVEGANIIPPGITLPSPQSSFNTAPTDIQYINVNQHPVVLGRTGEVTEYPNLEYIRCTNGLEIEGTVKLPKLKGVNVTGGNVTIKSTATVDFPILENFYAHGSFIVDAGAKINPANPRKNNPVNIYVGTIVSDMVYGVLTINCSSTVNGCKFYSGDININYTTNPSYPKGKFTSNSMFFPHSKANINLNGTSDNDTSGVIPQFYIPETTNIFVSPTIETLAGIFVTTSTDPVVNWGGGFDRNTELVGLFVGKFTQNWNDTPISNATVNSFDPDEVENLLMDGGVSSTGGGTTTITETEVTTNYRFKGLQLRETTGE